MAKAQGYRRVSVVVAATAVEVLAPPDLAIDDPQGLACRATVTCPVSRLSTRQLEISVSEQAVVVSWQFWVGFGALLAWGVAGVLLTPRSYPRLRGDRVVLRDVAEQSAHEWVQRNPAGSIAILPSAIGAAAPEPR